MYEFSVSLASRGEIGAAPISVGDFLLTFGRGTDEAQGRTAGPWSKTRFGAGEIALQETVVGWAGLPFDCGCAGNIHYWLFGDLYGNDDISDVIGVVVRGKTEASSLNGHFLLLAWNEGTRQWSIWTDRFGTIHCYYVRNGDQAALGTFFPGVAHIASARQLDWAGLTGFLGTGFFPGDRTYFQDVQILQPARRYVFDENGFLIESRRYWDWWHEPNFQRTFPETVSQFGDVFLEVISEHLAKGRVALPISGGLDSRSTVVAVDAKMAQEGRLWSYSYGYGNGSVENRIAGQIASARRLPYESFVIPPYLFDKLGSVIDATEGFQDLTQCRQAAIVGSLATNADSVIAAHMGDVWLDDMGLASDRGAPTSSAELAKLFLKKSGHNSEWLREKVCRQNLIGNSVDELISGFAEDAFSQGDGIEDLDFRFKIAKADTGVFRWSLASLRMFQAGAFPTLPFFDTRVTDFMATVPTEYLQGRRLQIEFIKRFAPDLAKIRWQVYDANLYRYQHFNSWQLPRRAFKKGWRTLTRAQVLQRNWEVQFFSNGGREGLRKWLETPGLRLHNYVPREEVSALVNSLFRCSGDPALGYPVSMLLTFSAWLEHHG